MSTRDVETRSYVVGLGLSVLLTVMAFAAITLTGWSKSTVLWLVGLLGIVQAVAQFRFFLHIDFSRQKREDLLLILFSILIIAMLVGGTIWIMASLATRMH